MPFPKAVSDWVRRVQGDRCLAHNYTEEHGFSRCENGVENVHHLEPEAWVLAGNEDFEDPNNGSTPIGLCGEHHRKIHPDLLRAYEAYRNGDKEAFALMSEEHKRAAASGEVFWMDDGDESMTERARENQERYVMEHPDDKRPAVKPHKRAQKKERWYDGLF